MKQIKGMRATIFAPQISFSSDTQKKILPLLNDGLEYIPVLSDMQPIQINGNNLLIPQNNNQWQLRSVNTFTQNIIFGLQKIDIVRDYNRNVEEHADFEDFCHFSGDFFSKLLNTFGLSASRIAFAPSYLLPIENNETVIKFVNPFFTKNKFKNAYIDNCDFSNVFRIVEDINGKSISINHLFKVELINRIDISKPVLSPQPFISIDVDINTKVEDNYIFNDSDILNFYSKIPCMAQEFIAFIFKEEK